MTTSQGRFRLGSSASGRTSLGRSAQQQQQRQQPQSRSQSQQQRGGGPSGLPQQQSQRQQQPQPQPQPQQQPQQQQRQRRRVWKAAVDPKSGRTYYYDTVTRETRWSKPVELASPEEIRAAREKERAQREFFAAMEGNILRSLERGRLPGSNSGGGGEEDETLGSMPDPSSKKAPSSAQGGGQKRKKSVRLLGKAAKPTSAPVRTISSMNDDVLAEMTKVGGGGAGGTGKKSSSPTSVAALPEPPRALASAAPSARSSRAGGAPVPLGATPMPSSSSSSSSREDRAVAQVRRVADEMAKLEGLAGDDLIDSGHSALGGADSMEYSDDGVDGAGAGAGAPPVPRRVVGDLRKLEKPELTNRNTCGTMYVDATMSAPDKDATIKCVCGVYRAHMLQAARDDATSVPGSRIKFDEYEVFNDLPEERRSGVGGGGLLGRSRSPGRAPRGRGVGIFRSYDRASGSVSRMASGVEALSLESVERAVPSLDEISAFYRDVFLRSQMEADCIIMSLIYVERLIKETNSGVRPRAGNWRSVLFACMVLSSKVWDDLSMWNADFSKTCPAGVRFTLQRINELELSVLNCLRFVVKVPASEYAKYYFLLRSMMIRSGLTGEDSPSSGPLDLRGARRLEVLSANFQAVAGARTEEMTRPGGPRGRRCKSYSEVELALASRATKGGGSASTKTMKASLEQVVKM